MNEDEVYTTIGDIVVRYQSGEYLTLDRLVELRRELVTTKYHLTVINTTYFEKHNAIQYMHKGSVASGLILANEQVPQLRKTRKLIEASREILKAMAQDIAVLRDENNGS